MSVQAVRSLGVLIAMREELDSFVQRWPLDWTGPGDFLTGRFRSMRIQVALSGAGLERAAATTDRLARSGQPDLLLNVGLSGGLSPRFELGDLLLADQVQNAEHETLDASSEWVARARAAVGCRTGGLLSLPVVLSHAADKWRMGQACPGAMAVDMESYAFARQAEAHGLPWISLRSISDTVANSLPLDFNAFFDRRGQVSRARLIGRLATRPQAVPPLIRFGGQVKTAQTRLIAGVEKLLGALAW